MNRTTEHSRIPRALRALAVAALCGCAGIETRVKGLETTPSDEVCLIENPAVRSGFLAVYEQTLEQLGYRHRMLPADAEPTACPLTSTYVARWSWATYLFMAYARILVFTDGAKSGEALYEVPFWWRQFGTREKFIDAETKIRELVQMLYPPRVPQP